MATTLVKYKIREVIKMEQKSYISPKFEVIEFSYEDIIYTSSIAHNLSGDNMGIIVSVKQ